MEWLQQQGPWCPALLEYLEKHHASYDALIFFTYLYAPTVLGLAGRARRKSILVPTAHDEPAIHLSIYKEVFAPAGGHRLQHRGRAPVPDHALLDPRARRGDGRLRRGPAPAPRLPARRRRGARGRAPEDGGEAPRRTAGEPTAAFRSHLTARGAMFRRRHRLHGPFALYGGRIEKGKGCEELIEYFSTYVERGRRGVAGADGRQADAAARGAVHQVRRPAVGASSAARPSRPPRSSSCRRRYESLSLLALEAFSVGTPVLANARSEVLVDHCVAQQRRAVLRGPLRVRRVPERCWSRDERLRAAHGPQRPRLRPAELPVGRHPGEVRADVREDRSGG